LIDKDIASAERWEAAGWRSELKWHAATDSESRGVEIEVPLLDRTDYRDRLRDSDLYQHGFYVVVTRK